eukprot:4555820-Prymnesium_polylepis.1
MTNRDSPSPRPALFVGVSRDVKTEIVLSHAETHTSTQREEHPIAAAGYMSPRAQPDARACRESEPTRDGRGRQRGSAAARACTCVRCGRGGSSPAVCAEMLYTPLVMRGGTRWATEARPPHATAFRGEGDGEGGVEGGGEGGDGDGDVGRPSGIRIAGDSGGDDRQWEVAEREATRRTRADGAVSQEMVP